MYIRELPSNVNEERELWAGWSKTYSSTVYSDMLVVLHELLTPQSSEDLHTVSGGASGLLKLLGTSWPEPSELLDTRSSRRPFPEIGRSFSIPEAPRDLSRSSCGCHRPLKSSAPLGFLVHFPAKLVSGSALTKPKWCKQRLRADSVAESSAPTSLIICDQTGASTRLTDRVVESAHCSHQFDRKQSSWMRPVASNLIVSGRIQLDHLRSNWCEQRADSATLSFPTSPNAQSKSCLGGPAPIKTGALTSASV
ncbi:hypothetical protein CROQUDRAFT_100933 [Cronartium quercuum f. sp. fusiforme G11]|uniref:Uncharacterized protein n=1 Tax=Cronartium quercuum f. sp. fusiforme G11 TaxID=708437 RepID=A0A9P6N5S1_9BASI|nr:hypothetical protein CROQUDRAFT_100933 [Cronartium quercuum f. sp. fusiforme G11]